MAVKEGEHDLMSGCYGKSVPSAKGLFPSLQPAITRINSPSFPTAFPGF